MDPVRLLSRALANTAQIVDALEPDQLGCPTPCSEWTVRDVLNHVVVGHHFSAAVVNGTEPPYAQMDLPDLVGDDPRGPYRAGAQVLLDAFSAPGALERRCATPAGEMPGAAWINFAIFDTYVHGWDLARAAGIDAAFPDEVTEPILGFVRVAFVMPDWPVHVMREPLDGYAGAAPMDQLVAYLGRVHDWKPTVLA
jgi:uncharacterized protein (TIGR03086 family)